MINIAQKDRDYLRKLATKVREIAEDRSMSERKKRLKALNSLKADRPVVLCFPEGSWYEIMPQDTFHFKDNNSLEHAIEANLRRTIIWWENFRDDNAIDPFYNVPWIISNDGWGVDTNYTHGADRGSYVWEPPIKNLAVDMKKLKHRKFSVDKKATLEKIADINSIFGDILPVRQKGHYWWTMGLTIDLISLIGLEPLMMYMYDEPENLHKIMGFMRDDMMLMIDWFEKEGLLSQHNENDYTGSGGSGYTDELPQKDWKPGQPVRLIDKWGFAESQETVGVSPEMFAEFIAPYQVPLMEKFGLNCYGCCEPVDKRMETIMKMPRIRRVSVSPWADREVCAKQLAGKAVFSRKPNPALLSASFNADELKKETRSTLDITKSIRSQVEIIMKDTHTCGNDITRFTRWIKMVYEEIGV